jgi:hypothetical protein
MGLKKRLAESEIIGFLSSIPLLIGGLVGRLFEDTADAEMQEKMRQASDRDKREVREAVTAFIEVHPALAPERFGIPVDRYQTDAFFAAVHGLDLLLRRYHRSRRRTPHERAEFILEMDGTVKSLDKAVLIPATSTQREVSRYIGLCYIPRREEMTWSLYKAQRQEAERISGIGLEHAHSFLRWIQAALRHQPELLHGFRALLGKSKQKTLLISVKPDSNEDRLAAWRPPNSPAK